MNIRILPETLANQIAAGEVVERPASVVRELVDNALDAGAAHVEVVLEDGGKRLIRVTDDGHGMARENLALAVERHATSKLPDDDLANIRYLGFRGEALPSIASVARLTLTSRVRGAANAWTVTVDNGRKSAPEPAALNGGTRVEVEDLFAKLPARLKFMKSDRAEEQAVLEVVKRIAMARPDVSFTVVLSGRTVRFQAYGTGEVAEKARLSDLLGPDFAANVIPIDAEREGFRLRGFAGVPTFHRATAAHQLLTVNGRPVKDRLLAGVIRAAYADVTPRDRHPVAVLMLDVDPCEVDVNVHPAKAEVRFRDAGLARALVISALKSAIGEESPRVATTGSSYAVSAFRSPQSWDRPSSVHSTLPREILDKQQQFFDLAPSADTRADVYEADEFSENFPLGAAKAQLHDTYILAQTQEGIALVDMHAAHERLVYEELKRQWAKGAVATQALLVPEVVELPADEASRIEAAADELAGFGLGVEPFGSGAILVRETPAALGNFNIPRLIKDIADALAEWGEALPLPEKLDRLAATVACHHSIRAGRRLKPEEMNTLLRQIEAEPMAAQCNHGRPTFVTLSRHDIEKLFARR